MEKDSYWLTFLVEVETGRDAEIDNAHTANLRSRCQKNVRIISVSIIRLVNKEEVE